MLQLKHDVLSLNIQQTTAAFEDDVFFCFYIAFEMDILLRFSLSGVFIKLKHFVVTCPCLTIYDRLATSLNIFLMN